MLSLVPPSQLLINQSVLHERCLFYAAGGTPHSRDFAWQELVMKLPAESTNRTLHMRRIFQITGWLLASAITVLSLVPPQYRPVTAAAHNVEHLAIFLSVGIAFGAGYPDRPWAVAIGLASFNGAIEIAQLWVPGRHARLIDFLVDITAACIGVGLVRVLVWRKGIGTCWELGGQRRNSGPRSRRTLN
jgi:VanZ family protein